MTPARPAAEAPGPMPGRHRARPVLLGVALFFALLVGTVGIGVTVLRASSEPPAPPALGLPLPAGPAWSPQRVALVGGRTLPCPSGTQPEVMLSQAEFQPPLADATTLLAGRQYRIGLRGTVANNTSATIRIVAVRLTAAGRPWPVRVQVPVLVPAQSSVDLVITGDYKPAEAERANLAAALDWRWADHALAACERGRLPEDD